MIFSIHVSGLGGQGVVTLTSLLARYTEETGYKTTIFTSKGMAQRGGRVTSDVRISDNPAAEFDPRIASGTADLLVGMELGEAFNSRALVRSGGCVLLYRQRTVPSSVVLDKNGLYPEFEEIRKVFLQSENQVVQRAEDTDKDREAEPLVVMVPNQNQGANIFVLGTLCASLPAAGAFFTIEPDAFMTVLRSGLRRNIESNIEAFMKGYEYGKEYAHRA